MPGTPYSDFADPLARAKLVTRRRIAIAAGLAAAAAVGIATALLLFGGSGAEKPRAAQAVAKQVPEHYEIDVQVTPTTAELVLDGERIGIGHYSGRMPSNGRTHELRVTADGFASQSFTFRDAAPPREIALTAAPKPSASPTRPSSPERPSRSVRTPERAPVAASKKSEKSTLARSSEPAAQAPRNASAEEAPPKIRVIKEAAPKIQVIE